MGAVVASESADVVVRFQSAHDQAVAWLRRITADVSAYRARSAHLHVRFLLAVDAAQQDLATILDCLRRMIRLAGGCVIPAVARTADVTAHTEERILGELCEASHWVRTMLDRLAADVSAADWTGAVRGDYETVIGMMSLAADQLTLTCEDAALVLQ